MLRAPENKTEVCCYSCSPRTHFLKGKQALSTGGKPRQEAPQPVERVLGRDKSLWPVFCVQEDRSSAQQLPLSLTQSITQAQK